MNRQQQRALDRWITREPPEPRCPKCNNYIDYYEELHRWECNSCGYIEKVEDE